MAIYLQRPLVECLPLILDAMDNNRLVGCFEPFDELVRRDIFDIDSFNLVVDAVPRQVEVFGVALFRPALMGFKFCKII